MSPTHPGSNQESGGRTEPTKRNHVIKYVRRERKWPGQWLSRCICGNAIRCNSEAEVWAFFRQQGCAT